MMLMPQMYRTTRTNYLNNLAALPPLTTMRGNANPCRRPKSAGYGRGRLTFTVRSDPPGKAAI